MADNKGLAIASIAVVLGLAGLAFMTGRTKAEKPPAPPPPEPDGAVLVAKAQPVVSATVETLGH